MTKEQHHHRSSLKQKNKPFKGCSGSKTRGRVEGKSNTGVSKPGRTLNTAVMSKKDRKNQASLIQAARRAELQQERRMFTGRHGVPRTVVLVPMSPSVQIPELLNKLIKRDQIEAENFADHDFVVYVEEHRQRLRWISADVLGGQVNLCQAMDAVTAGDVVVFLGNGQDEPLLTQEAEQLFAVIRAQGLSSAVALIQNAHQLTKQQKGLWQSMFACQMPNTSKVFFEATESFGACRESAELVRSLCSQSINGISWRDRRPYLVTEGPVQYDPSTGLLKIVGWARGGQPFSANRLVHLQSFGTFALDRIELVSSNSAKSDMAVDALVQKADPQVIQSLFDDANRMDAVDHDMEMEREPKQASTKETKIVKRKVLVPKGTSSYQAAWIAQENPDAVIEENEEVEEVDLSSDSDSSDDDDAMEADANEEESDDDDPYEREAHRVNDRLDRDFPDRVQLEAGQSARARFTEYRGLQSLRTSHWDPEEGLPAEYSQIYQFENSARSQQKALLPDESSPFAVGQRLALYVTGVPVEAATALVKNPFNLVYGLLPHEHRTSLLHFSVNLKPTETSCLVSRQEVVVWIGGIRRFVAQPIYSENNPNVALHKQLRAVEPGMTAIASVYCPIHYPPGPVLLFSPTTGALLSVGSVVAAAEPRRIVLQRITLTGAPYKIHRRAAVVRWMFDNPADVAWFKPVELCTKSGLRGNIKESLGTHGHFKALFDKPIPSNEPIAMHLYRRVFPPWNTTRLL